MDPRSSKNGSRSLAEKFPLIAREFSDLNLPLTASDFSGASHKKVWWDCQKHDHVFFSAISSRTRAGKGRGCPYCAGKATWPGFNDLASQRPDIASLYNLSENSKSPSEVTVSSRQKVWWKCASCAYDWQATPGALTRTDKKASGCPCCGQKATHVGCSDLATTHPTLSAEWSAKNERQPDEVSRGSRLRVIWSCATCSHEWVTQVKDRTRQDKPSGCPKCCTFRTSKIEQIFRGEFQDAIHGLDEDQNSYVLAGRKYQVDFLVSKGARKIAIEYDGEFFHGTYYDPKKPAKDMKKTEDLLSAGFLVVRIREGKLPFLELDHPDLLQLSFRHRRQQFADDAVKQTVFQVSSWLESKVPS